MEYLAAIISSIITGGCSVIAIIITVTASRNKQQADTEAKLDKQQAAMKAEFDKHEAVSDAKIDDLTKQVEKHNSIVERVFKLEKDTANLFHRFEETHELATEASKTANHAQERADAANNRLDRIGMDGRHE